MDKDTVKTEVEEYVALHNEAHNSAADRKANYERLVNAYYNLATDFYEWGWGQSFHFAPQAYTEQFQTAIIRHEHYLAHRIGT